MVWSSLLNPNCAKTQYRYFDSGCFCFFVKRCKYIQNEHVAPYLFHALPMTFMVRKDQAEEAAGILKDIKLSYSYGFRKNADDDGKED